MPNDPSNLRLGIGAIFKNEGPYILEWIAYHRVLGFSRFFIADNNSDDGSTALLASLAAAGVVEHIPFPGQTGKAPQLPAYTEILRRYGNEVDWLAFIDADEFFLPMDGSQSMLPFVAEMNAEPQIGLVAINWATYGSSHQVEAADEPVIERFSQRATRDYIHNHHYKSLVRTSANPTVRGSPHLFSIKPGAKTVQTNGAALVNHAKRGEGLSAEVVWDHVRLNHFIVKSRQEFFEKKGPKGRATVVGQTKGEGYFNAHDRNEETDPTPSWLIKATKAELSRLNRLLTVNSQSEKSASTPRGQRPLLDKMGSIAARLRNSLSAPPRQAPQISRGSIDRISIAESRRVNIAGWALLPDKRAAPLLLIKVGDQVVDGLEISRRSRPDVVRHFPGADPLSGFSISFPLNKLREPKADATVTLLAGSKAAGDPVANSPWPAKTVVSNATNGKVGIAAPDKKTGGSEVLAISEHLLRPTDLTEKPSISDVVSEPNSYFLAEASETVTASQPDVRNISGHAIQPTAPVFVPLADDNLFPAITRCPPVFVSHLKDAICHGDGIITQDNLVFSETFRSGVGRGHTKLTRAHLSLHSEGSTLPVVEEPTLYLDGEHFAGFGHFLGEVFSRLWIRKHIDIDQLKVAVGKGAWLPHIAELLECAGVKSHQVIELTQPTKFRSLIVASQSHVVRTGLSRLGAELYGDIADSIDPIVASTNVYLSRRLEKRRALVNEPDVERTFRQLGFDIVIPELLTMRAQISLFRHARYLAGPSGSNFFGLLFARQVNAAFVLTPSAYILHNEVVLASRSKTRLSYLVSHSEGILDNWVVEKGPLTDAVNHWLHKQIQNDNTGALSPTTDELRRARSVTGPTESTQSASTTHTRSVSMSDGERKPRSSRGFLDCVSVVGGLATIRGWAISSSGAPATSFVVTHANVPNEILVTKRLPRTDVARAHSDANLDCGFALTVRVSQEMSARDISCDAIFDSTVVRLAKGPKFEWSTELTTYFQKLQNASAIDTHHSTDSRRIFLIGPNKCGTSSFHHLFLKNGIASAHFETQIDGKRRHLARQILNNTMIGRPVLHGMDEIRAFSDMTFTGNEVTIDVGELLPTLHNERQDDYYILNTRHIDKWIQSRFLHNKGTLVDRYIKLYGCSKHELELLWRRQFTEHQSMCISYFGDSKRFRIFDIEEDDPSSIAEFLSEDFDIDPKEWRKTHTTMPVSS